MDVRRSKSARFSWGDFVPLNNLGEGCLPLSTSLISHEIEMHEPLQYWRVSIKYWRVSEEGFLHFLHTRLTVTALSVREQMQLQSFSGTVSYS